MTGQRLDEALVARGLYPSRARARDAVLRGTVSVNGAPARKPSQSILETDVLAAHDSGQQYVSRSALKLIHALDHFKIDVEGRACLDIGASTGGFSQVLLERGASHVTAIDVGHGQMALSDPRHTNIEGINARDLTPTHLPANLTLITCDVSFISLTLALSAVLNLAPSETKLIALIKPQFEVGRDAIGKGGIVKDQEAVTTACAKVQQFIASKGWHVFGFTPSPIAGGDGNREFLVAAQKL